MSVDPNKIVAGMEPESTNQMLQIFASIAIDVANGELSMPQILENLNSGPSDDAHPDQHRQHNEENEPTQPPTDTAIHRQEPPPKQPSPPVPSTEATAPAAPSTLQSAPDKEQWLLDTQRTLGALIDRPRLLDKLLRRPPFRFLFEIVQSLIKATGFPLQFLDETADIANADIKDAKFKFHFLSKLIVIASAATDHDLSSVDPKQIIAGRNPEGTNLLLTRLAEAATAELDVEAVRKRIVVIGQQQRAQNEEQKKQTTNSKDEKQRKSAQKKPEEAPSSGGTNTARKNAPIMPKLELEQLQKTANKPMSSKPPKPAMAAKPVKPVPVQLPQTEAPPQPFAAIQKLQRPRTARRAPPKLKSNVVEQDKGSELKNAVIIMDDTANNGGGADGDGDAEDIEHIKETKEDSELQRLGFIDPHDHRHDRERNERAQGVDELENAAEGDHGKLVRDILDAQSGIKLDTMKLGTHRKDSAKSVERMESMREMIQTLCQTCLPLGKCIDLVFQDVEAINTELLKWKQLIATNQAKLTQQREQTDKVLAPLHRQLKEIEESITRQNHMILEKKAVLLRNEAKTTDIIRKRLLNE